MHRLLLFLFCEFIAVHVSVFSSKAAEIWNSAFPFDSNLGGMSVAANSQLFPEGTRVFSRTPAGVGALFRSASATDREIDVSQENAFELSYVVLPGNTVPSITIAVYDKQVPAKGLIFDLAPESLTGGTHRKVMRFSSGDISGRNGLFASGVPDFKRIHSLLIGNALIADWSKQANSPTVANLDIVVTELRSLTAPFEITDVVIGAAGRLTFRYPADSASYYILYRGNSVNEIKQPANLALGGAAVGELSDTAGTSIKFYRILQVPISRPLDTDGDGIDDVYELRRGPLLNALNARDAFEDPDRNGLTNLDEYQGTTSALTTIIESSPANGEAGVAVTRETVLRFSHALATNTVIATNQFFATFGGRRILSRSELSSDRRSATLFYLEPLPGSARVRVTFNGDGIKDAFGRLIDAENDGKPGGVATIDFDTLTLTTFKNTIVYGRVFASELQKPVQGQTNQWVNVPLAGVIVTADGLEEKVRAVTDNFGDFRLTNAPAGPFFVHIDGRTVTNLAAGIRYPDLAYYPYVGKEWVSFPGGETNIGEIYLPLVSDNTLKRVSLTEDTVVTFPASIITNRAELAGVSVTVPANALFSDNGTRGGMVGIAPVAPDRLPGPLPDGLKFPLVITIQTDGPSNFDRPVPVRFPNLPDSATGVKLPPGAKSALWSFNHDLGRWEVVGPMTVSADGNFVESDPGYGVRQPGWHGTNPGTGGGGGGGGGPPGKGSPPPPDPNNPGCNPAIQSCGPPCPPDKTNPILLYSGEKYEQIEDLRIHGVGLDFVWVRTYGSQRGPNTAQGNSWDFSYNICLFKEGRSVRFCNGAWRDDTFVPVLGTTNQWARSGFFQELSSDAQGRFILAMADQKRLVFVPFNGSPTEGKIDSIVDRNGNTIRFGYDGQGRLNKITDTLDRAINVGYNVSGFISSITDFTGRSVRYDYYQENELGGGFGDLKSVTSPAVAGTPNGNDFPSGKTTSYTYTKGFADERLNHNLLTITDGRRNDPKDATYGQGPYLVNIYSPSANPDDITFDRVIRQVRGGDINDLTYVAVTPAPENNGAVEKVILNDRNGNVSEHFYDAGNRLVMLREYTGRADPRQPTTETANRPANKLRPGDPAFFETRWQYNADSLPTRIVHPNGNITENVYASEINPLAPPRTRGNLLTVRRLPGTHAPSGDQTVVVETFEYASDHNSAAAGNCCGFNFVTRHVDGRGNELRQQYDDRGNLTNRINRLSRISEQWEYNARGQMTRHILPENGSGSRRLDRYLYYTSGPQRGYLQNEVIDDVGFKLTTSYEYDLVGNVTRRIDPRGHDTQFVVNALNQTVREISAEVLDGTGVRYAKDFFYDANNNLIRVETENRLDLLVNRGALVETNKTWTTTYAYDILNFLTNKTGEVEADRFVVTEYSYDGNKNRIFTRFGEATAGRQPKNVVQTLYDERDLPFREIRAPGDLLQSTIQFDYDGNRNRTRVWHGLEEKAHLTQFVFDGFNREVRRIDAMGNVTTNRYDPNGNRTNTVVLGELADLPGSTNNVRLSETTFTFDPLNRLVRQDVAFFNSTNQAPIGDGLATTQTIYTDNSQVLAIINDNGHGRTNRYDTANRLRTVTDAKQNTITYDYDPNSNATRAFEVEKSDLGGLDETFSTTYSYDNLNRLIATTDNVGNVNRAGFDSRNNRVVTVDALTNRIDYTFDGLNRLLQTTRHMTRDGTGTSPVIGTIITRQTWDNTSRLTSQIDDNGNATSYLYDALNRKFVTVYADGTGQTNWFDVHDNTLRMTDGNLNVVVCAYDALDRITRKEITPGPGVSDDTTFEVFKNDGLSRLVHAEDNDSLVTRSHDSLSHVTREVQNLTGFPAAVVGTAYDVVGNLTRLEYPSGRVVTTTYDELERKKTISDADGMIATYWFVGFNRVTRRDYGNGTRLDITYDGITGTPNPANDFGVKRITRTRHTRVADASVIDDRTFTWDRTGNKTQQKDIRLTATQMERDYAYDSIYRLVRSTQSGSVKPSETINYRLDGVGNRVEVGGGLGGGTYSMASTAPIPRDLEVNQYTSTTLGDRSYDENGNIVSEVSGAIVLIHDAANRLVRWSRSNVKSRSDYDALGRRTRKIVNASDGTQHLTRFFYVGWRMIEEQTTPESTVTAYTHGRYIDELLGWRNQGQDIFLHADDLYSTVGLSDINGNSVERYQYEDYGEPTVLAPDGGIRSESKFANHHQFTGRYYDWESGLYDYRSRRFDCRSGRFMTRDFFGTWFDRSALGGAFTYAGNNPLSFLDPFGELAVPCGFDPEGGGDPGRDPKWTGKDMVDLVEEWRNMNRQNEVSEEHEATESLPPQKRSEPTPPDRQPTPKGGRNEQGIPTPYRSPFDPPRTNPLPPPVSGNRPDSIQFLMQNGSLSR